MSSRPKGEGSIYQSADGRWHGSMDLGIKPNGKRDRRHVTAKTKTAVAKKLKRLRDDRESGVVGGGRTITVEVWARQWLAEGAERWKPSTSEDYRKHVECYIVSYLGHRRLDLLNRADVENMLTDMARRPKAQGKRGVLSSSTIHHARRVLRACLADAERAGLVARNAAADARPARLVAPEREPLTRTEAQAVVTAASRQRNGARWVVALALGLRQGEALGLSWDDLDLDAGRISIRRTIYRGAWKHGCVTRRPCGRRPSGCPDRIGGGLVLSTPKSTAGTRSFALPPSVIAVLRQHRKAQAAERLAAGNDWEPGPFGGAVFATVVGRFSDPKRDWSAWKSLLAEAGVREVRVHDARHTAATLALLSGTPDRIVMARMGWSQVSMLTRYQHSITEADEAAAQAMDDTLFGQASRPKPRRRRSG